MRQKKELKKAEVKKVDVTMVLVFGGKAEFCGNFSARILRPVFLRPVAMETETKHG